MLIFVQVSARDILAVANFPTTELNTTNGFPFLILSIFKSISNLIWELQSVSSPRLDYFFFPESIFPKKSLPLLFWIFILTKAIERKGSLKSLRAAANCAKKWKILFFLWSLEHVSLARFKQQGPIFAN